MQEINQNPQNPQYPPQQYARAYAPRRRSRWWIPVVIIVALLLIFILLIVGMFGFVGSSFFGERDVEVKSNSVLTLSLSEVKEFAGTSPFDFTGGARANLFDMIQSIKRAKTDKNIRGIYIKPGVVGVPPVKSSELQNALLDFKKSGKFIYAFFEAANENGYFSALPADSIFMPTEGMVELNGFGVTNVFLKDMLEKVGIKFTVVQFEEYKSAGEQLSRMQYSDSARKEILELLSQRAETFISKTAELRKIPRDKIADALRRGVYTAEEARNEHFIDALKSESDLKDMMKRKVFGRFDPEDKLHFVSIHDYSAASSGRTKESYDSDKQIAIIYGSGEISSGKMAENPFASDDGIRSGDFVKNLRKARENKKIKAIILRIDSPGGSVIASDEIWEEIRKTRQVKPVYASMSDVAASGGYYMAMACDTIIAHPETITGSIGVILAIPNFAGAKDVFGFSSDTVSVNPEAQFFNGLYPYSKKDMDRIVGISRGIYNRFVSKVAQSRGFTFERARALAKGRIWTGAEAKERGLVDVLGGIDKAIEIAKRRIGVPEGKKVRIVTLPRRVDAFASLLRIFHSDDDDGESVNASAAKFAKAFGLTPEQYALNSQFMPDEMKRGLGYLFRLSEMSKKEKVLMALPSYFEIQ